jgi:lactate dehydrogenase-like 2-hydroxyacid dehydrogenase
MSEPLVVVPDDFPSVFKGTPAEERCRRLGETRVFVERGADGEAELTRRLGAARIAINIRAHARFSDAVLAACPRLQMISVWGTGTDNIDLESAQRRENIENFLQGRPTGVVASPSA